MAIGVLALDLERTLIDDARSGRPRPGLRAFLQFCDTHFARIAIFTTVDEANARAIIDNLTDRDYLSSDLCDRLEFIAWTGEYKDLHFIPHSHPEDVRLVDDDAGWIRPDQRKQWIAIAPWDGGVDDELLRVQAVLKHWLADEI